MRRRKSGNRSRRRLASRTWTGAVEKKRGSRTVNGWRRFTDQTLVVEGLKSRDRGRNNSKQVGESPGVKCCVALSRRKHVGFESPKKYDVALNRRRNMTWL